MYVCKADVKFILKVEVWPESDDTIKLYKPKHVPKINCFGCWMSSYHNRLINAVVFSSSQKRPIHRLAAYYKSTVLPNKPRLYEESITSWRYQVSISLFAVTNSSRKLCLPLMEVLVCFEKRLCH